MLRPLTCRSVSSVKTLEEAKVMKGCLYMQMPVQEVRPAAVLMIASLADCMCSTELSNLASSRRSKRRAITQRWTSSRSLRQMDCFRLHLSVRRASQLRVGHGAGALGPSLNLQAHVCCLIIVLSHRGRRPVPTISCSRSVRLPTKRTKGTGHHPRCTSLP